MFFNQKSLAYTPPSINGNKLRAITIIDVLQLLSLDLSSNDNHSKNVFYFPAKV